MPLIAAEHEYVALVQPLVPACRDPHFEQPGETIYHYQVNQHPGQSTRLCFANAQKLSDPGYQPGTASDMKTACLANSDFPGEQRDTDYCACTTTVIARNAPDRVVQYSKRFKQLEADFQAARTALERGQNEHPDIRVFGNMRSSCVRD